MEESSILSVNMTQNPFDTESLDSLHLPQCSPSVFAIKENKTSASSTKKTPKFRWSIDQMAILHPVEIEELPYQQQDSKLDEETEEKVQAAINKFFSQQQVVPSPWSEPKLLKGLSFTPNPQTSANKTGGSDNSKGVLLKPKPKTVNATCQTMLSLPMDFDLEAILGSKHFNHKEEKSDYEIMSTSSLRRKLFQCDVTPPLSPVKGTSVDSSRESMPFIISSPPISPIRAEEDIKPVEPDNSMLKTPSSAKSQFSSSPISSKVTPIHFLRMSGLLSDPSEMESPSMSPIRDCDITTPFSNPTSDPKYYTKSDSKNAFLPDDSSISMSIVESPIRPINVNGKRTYYNCGLSCPSPCAVQDKMAEDSSDTWSKDLCDHPSQKLTSTMKLQEPIDSLGLTFEPRLCSSRLMGNSIQDSKGHSSGVMTSEAVLTTSEVKQDKNIFGGFKEALVSTPHCNTPVASKQCKNACAGFQSRVPSVPKFGACPKAVAMEMTGTNSDSGINTYSVLSFEPTDMEIIEER